MANAVCLLSVTYFTKMFRILFSIENERSAFADVIGIVPIMFEIVRS